MASGAVWGIDVGQCALKALRCRPGEDPDKIVAEAFDYIEYPKILSQPGSDPAELVGDALKQFLSRNSVVGDRVAISVVGQAGLARFIKLPPVEAKKIPDIVRYEARQQIPFDLNDVIWDYQRMGGGSEEEGFALETEIGLFAMKRDAVFRTLGPFLKADIEVDIVQLAPLVLYNFLVFDQMQDLAPAEEYDPENPPESVVILSLGTDSTDLVISNGHRVWQRSIPLGGSHFTKVLTKELKLTFAKAEHLKRNATAAADPKAVFQAMRPVFGDLLTELQRSIGYFCNLDRAAKISRIVALGNAMKLPGLRRYLSQSLGYEIDKIESFRGLTGSQVLSAPTFQENLLSFGVSYGLALQALNKGKVHTNLLPREIIKERIVKRKKPWAVAAAAVLLLGCSISYAAYSLALGTVDPGAWKDAEGQSTRVAADANRFTTESEAAMNEFKATDQIGQHLVGNVEGRIRWLELLRAVADCLPQAKNPPPKAGDPAIPIPDRNELHITNLECQQVEDVSQWFVGMKQWHQEGADAADKPAGGAPAAAVPGAPAAAAAGAPMAAATTGGDPMGGAAAADAVGAAADPNQLGPKGPGWVVCLGGHHYHNADQRNQGAEFVRRTLIEGLRKNKVLLPAGERGSEEVSMSELGITYPVLVNPKRVYQEELVDPNIDPDTGAPGGGMGGGMPGGPGIHVGPIPGNTPAPGAPPAKAAGDGPAAKGTITVPRFDFVVQFCWQPKTPAERREAKKAREQATTPSQP